MDQRTPLGDADPAELAAFWQRFLAATGRHGATPRPDAWPFGDSVELADELIALVLAGTKRATAGAVAEYEAEGDPIPVVGDLEIALDGAMRPRAVLRVTDVRVGPLSSVDDRFAYDEGEGDRTRRYWLDAHTTFFARFLPTIGVDFDPDMATIFQRFDVPYQED
ncbi:MAG: ASCH domain-containing protein [Actinomycetota bacterium]